MHVASREVCRELHALSGWSNTEFAWRQGHGGAAEVMSAEPSQNGDVPAYDLGYLLRRLPPNLREHLPYAKYTSFPLTLRAKRGGYRVFYRFQQAGGPQLSCEADSPEQAAAQLAIALFRSGLLTGREA